MPLEKNEPRHRAGVFKQQNKNHKHGRHRSKGLLDILNKGRVKERKEKVGIKKLQKGIGKEWRRNQAIQLRKKKREETLKRFRKFNEAPILIALVSLSDNVSYFEIMERVKKADPTAHISYTENGYVHISIPRFKQRYTFVLADTSRIYHTLDVLKIADTVLFLTSVNGLSENSDIVMTCITSQGLPNVILSVTDLQTIPLKKRSKVVNDLQKITNQWLPGENVMHLETDSDILTVFRKIGSQKIRPIVQRDRRPYLLTEEMDFIRDDKGGENILTLSGYLRGQTLSVNDLIHIPGWKDFKMKKLEIHPDPLIKIDNDKIINNTEIFLADSLKQQSLDSENIPDVMDGEQTWPTEEELKEAANREMKTKKVPKGFSEYQAAWITEDSDDDRDSTSSVADEIGIDDIQFQELTLNDSDGEIAESKSEAGHDYDTTSVTTTENMDVDKYDKNTNLEEEKKEREKIKKAKEDEVFPDEVDTPLNEAARIRFQRYRGLKSFRTSPWDPKENLPADYARIFQFENFSRTKKRVLKDFEEKIGAEPGNYVKIYLDGVTEMEFNSIVRTSPIVVVGMLPHEQKMSVVNMVLKQPNIEENKQPIKSKEELIFQCGYRRFKCCPIFSQHAKGNIYKYERYFQTDAIVVATVYAPIIFPPSSVLAFKELKDSSVHLVATGSVLSIDPNRIVVKRTILSGYPLKVNKKSAVIRFMFHNREDVVWFKPIELRTKYGRRGHIKEPLGTHGHMKCIFDNQLKSQDTVLLNLYKRVFPKWTYNKLYTTVYLENS